MKLKLLVVLAVMSLLTATFGTASAQEKTPSDPLWYSSGVSRLAQEKGARGGDPVVPASSAPVFESAAGSNLAAVTSPIINGDFEQGRNVGWAESSNHGYPIVTSSPPVTPHSGSWIAYLNSGDIPTYTDTTLAQANITIIAPTTLRFSYWTASQDECGWDYAYVKFNSTIVYSWSVCADNNTYGWQTMELSLNGFTGQTGTLSIELITDAECCWSAMLVDDVSLYGTFSDVPYGYGFWKFIEGLYDAGVTSGCSTSPMMYCPTTTVTRDQMAVFLLTAKHGSGYVPPAAVGLFNDVPIGHWADKWIERLAAEGITSGCGGGNYCPNSPVTRAQMAVFLLTAKHGAGYAPPDPVGLFSDVPTDHWAARWIEELANEGITGGCGGGKYCPDNPVSRDQMAVFLVTTFGLPTP